MVAEALVPQTGALTRLRYAPPSAPCARPEQRGQRASLSSPRAVPNGEPGKLPVSDDLAHVHQLRTMALTLSGSFSDGDRLILPAKEFIVELDAAERERVRIRPASVRLTSCWSAAPTLFTNTTSMIRPPADTPGSLAAWGFARRLLRGVRGMPEGAPCLLSVSDASRRPKPQPTHRPLPNRARWSHGWHWASPTFAPRAPRRPSLPHRPARRCPSKAARG